MTRLVLFAACILSCGLFAGLTASADDPPKKLTAEEQRKLFAERLRLDTLARQQYEAGKYSESQQSLEDALELSRRLYPKGEFPNGHENLAASMNNLALALEGQGRFTAAAALYRDSLAMKKALVKGDDADVAQGLNNLSIILRLQGNLPEAERLATDALLMLRRVAPGDVQLFRAITNNLAQTLLAQGKHETAERLFRTALDMTKRFLAADHTSVEESLQGLAVALATQGKYEAAEALYREGLDVAKRHYKGDHPNLAYALESLASVLFRQGKYRDAEALCRDSLGMEKRLNSGDHPNVANCMTSLGWILQGRGEYSAAESLGRESLEMRKRLSMGSHPDAAIDLMQLAVGLHAQAKYREAEVAYREALAINRAWMTAYARMKSEGEALTLLTNSVGARAGFLSVARASGADATTVYSEVWAEKAAVSRVYEYGQQAARAVTDPKAARLLAELADTRRRRAELLLAPVVKDPATNKKREQDLRLLDGKLSQTAREIQPLLPAVGRAEKLEKAAPGELQKLLPADAAVLDFLRYVHLDPQKDNPGKPAPRYTVFVVTRGKVSWVELGHTAPIETAAGIWREAITSGKEVPAELPAKVRELVWEKVRKELPAGTKTLYISPDEVLCTVPWAALPGDKPGTILLQDFAVATIPHAQFLLDKLWEQDKVKNPPVGVLVVGGVSYDAEVAAPAPNPGITRGNPLVKPGAKPGWPFLPATVAEASGVAGAAAKRKIPVVSLKEAKATKEAILAELPRARYAHLATHGFFADPSFRSDFQLDEKDFRKSLGGERIGRAVNSPLVMTGLVLAGANNPKTPGRGIATGESLIDLDLSGLELAVLSACETGLGDVAGGEGTFGLQRAFHLAGTRDVVASLWKVPDQPTAALMALFYHNLWEKNLSPVESLRQAQLEIYRNPGKIVELAQGFRGKFEEVAGANEAAVKPTVDGKAHPRLWAAFTLSGPGR